MLGASKREASMRTSIPKLGALALAAIVAFAPAYARQGEPPYTFSHPAKSSRAAPVEEIGTIDAAARRQDADAAALGAAPTKRLRTADPLAVAIDTARHGAWSEFADGSRLWRVEIHVEGATDLRLAFAH